MLLQISHCLGVLATYIVPALLILVPVRFLTRLPSFIFRKLLHFIAFTGVSLMILAAGSWQAAALTSILIAAALYPVLALLERATWYEKLLVQKTPGEIKKEPPAAVFHVCGSDFRRVGPVRPAASRRCCDYHVGHR